MSIPLHVCFTDVQPSESLQAAVRGEVADLGRYFSGVVSCRVLVGEPHRHHRRGRHYQVKIVLAVPGDELVVSHEEAHGDAYQCVRSAFHVARRELEDYVRRMRREVKTHLPLRQPA